jgi:site-specific recombinase XerD
MFSAEATDASLAAFLGYLERVGRAPATRTIYARAVEDLLDSLRAERVAVTSAADIDRYLTQWRGSFVRERGRLPSPSTYRNPVNALRAFYAWMERFDLLKSPDGAPLPNPMRGVEAPRVEQRANDWLRPPEDRALLDAPLPEHERFIVLLLRWTGLRVSEAVSLTWTDVDLSFDSEKIAVRHSKTPAGRRSVPILPPLLPDLRTRAAMKENWSEMPVLMTRQGTSMKPTYVWRVVKRAAFRARVRVVPCTCGSTTTSHERNCMRTSTGEHLSRVSPHTLRRTFGSYLLNKGVRLEVVSQLLGHASTSVTEKAYAELLYETTRREVLRALHRERS